MRKLSKKLPPILVAPPFDVKQSIIDGAGKSKPPKQGVEVSGEDNPAAERSNNNCLGDFDVLGVAARPGAGAQSTECGEGEAVAASTAAYKTRYGSRKYRPNSDDKSESESSGTESLGNDSRNEKDSVEDDEGAGDYMGGESDDSKLYGIDDVGSILPPVDIDDKDYVDIDIDSESEDGMRSLFPREKNPSKNLVIGGPQPQSTEGMTAAEAKLTREEGKRKRKQWTDLERNKRMKMNAVGSPPCHRLGCDSDLLRMMVEVENDHLRKGHMFSTKDIFWMRIGEEALLRNIHV